MLTKPRGMFWEVDFRRVLVFLVPVLPYYSEEKIPLIYLFVPNDFIMGGIYTISTMSFRTDVWKYNALRILVKRFILPILVVFMISRGLSVVQIASIATIGTIVSFIFEIPSGAIADWLGHRRTLIYSLLGQGAAMFMYLGGGYWWILAGSAIYCFASTFMSGTAEAMFYERLKAEKKEHEYARYQGQGKGLARLVGVLSMTLAGFAYMVAWYLPFLIGAVQFFVAAIVISTFEEAKQQVSVKQREGRVEFISHFSDAWFIVMRNKKIFWLMIVGGLIAGPLFATADLQQIVMTNAGISAGFIGVIYSVKRVFGFISQTNIYRLMKHIGPPALLAVSAVLTLMNIILPALFLNHVFIGIAVSLSGLVTTSIAVSAYVNDLIPSGSRATVLSVGNMFENVFQVLTTLAFGYLSLWLSPEHSFIVIGSMMAVGLTAGFIGLFTSYSPRQQVA